MSIYGYLSCHDCRQILWLGKAIRAGDRPVYFHRGPADEPPHWRRDRLNQTLWKFLADHTGHRIDVQLEHMLDDASYEYCQIGGEEDGDISVDEYLDGWPGLGVAPLDRRDGGAS